MAFAADGLGKKAHTKNKQKFLLKTEETPANQHPPVPVVYKHPGNTRLAAGEDGGRLVSFLSKTLKLESLGWLTS